MKIRTAAHAGLRLPGGSEKATPPVRSLASVLRKCRLQVEDLNIVTVNGAVTVYGRVKNRDAAERVTVALANIVGVVEVDASRLEIEEPGPSAPAEIYVVRRGDTLRAIARAHLGDEARFPEIVALNDPPTTDPHAVGPGWILRVLS